MNDKTRETNPEPDSDAGEAGLIAQLTMMIDALWSSPVRNQLLLQAALIVGVVAVTAYGQIRLNAWNQPFYDAISRHDVPEFMQQLGVFGLIAGVLLVLNVAQRWLGEMSKVTLRKGLVEDLVHRWMRPGSAGLLAHSGPLGLNPDQRMHEDARHLSELSADLAIGLLQSTILLGTFSDVLWAISSRFEFAVGGHDFVIPGYMVWAAVLYSASASLLSFWVGRSLVDRNADHYAREADLRYSLVRVNENIDSIHLAGGERQEESQIKADLAGVLAAMRSLVFGLANLTWVTAGSGWITIVAPIIAAAPLYFAGQITFGGLMLASGAFMQVQSALRWFVDNFSTLADWRATLLRVASFRRALFGNLGRADQRSRIERRSSEDGRVRIEDMVIDGPTGSIALSQKSVEITAGERVLIVGNSGVVKHVLFRALAGLWPWGSGSVTLSDGANLMCMPHTAYLPRGTLRQILAYPASVDAISGERTTDVLTRLGLERLLPDLDSARRWDQTLDDEVRQLLVFARVFLRRPTCLLMDEVFELLDEETLARVWAMLAADLPLSTIIYIGRPTVPPMPFTRVLRVGVNRAQAQAPSPQSGNAVTASA